MGSKVLMRMRRENSHSSKEEVTKVGSLEVVRILMIMVLSFSFFLNLFLGLEFTYMIPRNKYVTLFAAFLGFLSGALMLCAILLYRQKLEKGKSVYFSSYKESWVTATSYLNVFFLFASVQVSHQQLLLSEHP
ncbi:Transmembrane protein 225 [Tupaia chinensis]|uniref:Transmembrane protein 225 n=1 Tax=Tupaia chinensis TaxID=246437 RepID=L9KTP0_TUPCH|nr:Transmembrane protein 225 [Tupaia chinensis]